jgi:hypothetical protein
MALVFPSQWLRQHCFAVWLFYTVLMYSKGFAVKAASRPPLQPMEHRGVGKGSKNREEHLSAGSEFENSGNWSGIKRW